MLDLTGDAALRATAAGWTDRVALVTASCVEPPAAAVLIRPDGYVAWAGWSGTDDGKEPHEALGTWFGEPVLSLG